MLTTRLTEALLWTAQTVKRKPGKPGRPRTVNRLPGGSQDMLLSPAADARCQVCSLVTACGEPQVCFHG